MAKPQVKSEEIKPETAMTVADQQAVAPAASSASDNAALAKRGSNLAALIKAAQSENDTAILDAIRMTGARLIAHAGEKEWVKAYNGLIIPCKLHGIAKMDDKDQATGEVRYDPKTGEVKQRFDFVAEIVPVPNGMDIPPIFVRGNKDPDPSRYGTENVLEIADGRGIKVKARIARPGDLVLIGVKHATMPAMDFVGEYVMFHFIEKVAIPGTPKTVWRVGIYGF